MTYEAEEFRRFMASESIFNAPLGWSKFIKISEFLDEYTGEEKKIYCGWIREYLKTPLNKEKARVDDL